MFNDSDFKIPLESELRLRVINDEIDSCNDVESLKNHLKETSRLIMVYQHLLTAVAKEAVESNLTKWIEGDAQYWRYKNIIRKEICLRKS